MNSITLLFVCVCVCYLLAFLHKLKCSIIIESDLICRYSRFISPLNLRKGVSSSLLPYPREQGRDEWVGGSML